MTDVGLGIFFVTLFLWVPAAWVFFDAQERGHSAYLWGALTLMFSLAVLVVYFIVRSRGVRRQSATYSRGRIYLHVATMTFWGLAAVGTAVALFGVFQRIGATEDLERFGTSLADRDQTLREALAFGVAILVICLPAVVLHLLLLRRQVARAEGADRLSLARLQSGLFSLLVVLGGLLAFAVFASAVFGVTALAFDVDGQIGREGWATILSLLVVSLLSLALATALFWLDAGFQQGREELRTAESTANEERQLSASVVAASVAPAAGAVPSTSGRFCSQCGTALASGARFCAACGAPVASAIEQ